VFAIMSHFKFNSPSYFKFYQNFKKWAGSCWYYLRFTDTKNRDSIFSSEAASWLPVDLYVGGQEHAVLHLLYARFWHKVLYDIGVVDHPEPFLKLVHQGMILGADGEKMSKSKGNVVNPDDVVKEHGADALRLYEMFMGPLEAVKPWQTNQLIGVVRFRDKVFNLVSAGVSDDALSDAQMREMHKTIKKVTKDIELLSFNTAISQMMVFTNYLRDIGSKSPREALEVLVLLVSPFAPHVAEECWALLGHKKSLSSAPWPTYKEELCVDSVVTVAIQVNGKVRGTVDVEKTLSESAILELALTLPGVTKFTSGLDVKKIVYVQGKILNIVVAK
jgi:leucyl-tRNA synthetase